MEYKTIEGFDNYKINENAEIINKKTNRVMKSRLNHDGYYVVGLVKNKGEQREVRVHRLLAVAFIPNPENKETIDHINRIRTDNRIENLRWATLHENFNNRLCEKVNKKITKTKIEEIFNKKKWLDATDFFEELLKYV